MYRMRQYKKGGVTPIVIGLIVLFSIAGGAWYVASNNGISGIHEGTSCTADAKLCPDGSSVGRTGPNCEFIECPGTQDHMDDSMMREDTAMMKEDDGVMMKKNGGAMMETDDDVIMQKTEVQYSGNRLAGNDATPLLEFNQADYDRAIQSGDLIVLYFYANWCPTCRIEFPRMEDAFDELHADGVVGFRVNYNDNQTDDNEENLARQFGVAYQHTKVFVKNGSQVLKAPDSWSKDRFINEIMNVQ